MTNESLRHDLQELIEFLEANPDGFLYANITLFHRCETKEQIAEWAKRLAPCKKEFPANGRFYLTKKLNDSVELWAAIDRDKVCTKTVTKVEKTRPVMAPTGETKTYVEEIVEWDCPESILAAAKGDDCA